MAQQTIEQMVASAILEKATDEIEINGEAYPISDPSIATLILVSEIISTLPVVEKVPKEQVVYSALHYAKDFKAIGDICAILILGANKLQVTEKKTIEKRILGLFTRKKTVEVVVDKQKELSRLILDNLSPSTVFNLIIRRLQDMEVGHFFSITTSLSEANILKPTKEVVS